MACRTWEIATESEWQAAPADAAPQTDSPVPFELHNLQVKDIQLQLLDHSETNTAALPHMIAGVQDISLKLSDGDFNIHNIRIPNIEGFTASNLFHIADISAAIDPGSIHSDQFVINKIFIDTPEIDPATEVTRNPGPRNGNLTISNPIYFLWEYLYF